MGATFGPVTILALYWRRFNFWGALASIVTGAATVTVWQFSAEVPAGLFDMAVATAPGFVVAMLIAIVVTLFTSPPAAEIAERFDRVNAES